ncbi:MAG TPA: branched-chain amino acid ABC transporter substrate-binding protein [Defluviitaleaceae bacterium]|nr:branched-chain amino acid ABC transporter substrate-binding protein [Candidatus Epulonipiscium sp.]HOQ15788.1 branched-chain amino acid ABC transporter substrate-binding protein [Defluviitaleaceae bacterium]HPT75917.1 branched-chain amino acid ABC transporter substrate-binding protein [Defluviitaleaceae bacterium]HQD49835.1 branched-chain amino acid ABC transporter substrate-binding protein [Defluviitaleaceae bacterium]
MAIDDTSIIDWIAMSQDEQNLVMLITDHLDRDEDFEQTHLFLLQEKINVYLAFIDSREYIEVYPGKTFNHFVIEVHFLNAMSQNCKNFIDTVNRELEKFNIRIEAFN